MTGEDGWRYRKGDEDKGAVTWDRLLAMAHTGELADDDYVYFPSRQRWVKAWEVPGLFDLEAQSKAVGLDAAAARRRRILLIVVAVDVAVTLAVGVALFVLFANG